MAKQKRLQKPAQQSELKISDPDWGLVYKFAIALEKGRFNDYIATLQSPKQLVWKSFLSGAAKGLGAVLGTAIVLAIIAGIIAGLMAILPDPADNALEGVGKQLQQPGKQ